MAALLSYIGSLFHGEPPLRKSKYDLPLPKICHLVLDEGIVKGRALFVIGDVHGCYDELCDLIKVARNMEGNVLFLFVGDLINRGPKSKEVLDLLREIDCYSVRGNHEESALRQKRWEREDNNYVLPDRYKWIHTLTDDDFRFIAELPYTISIPSEKAIIVHAGIVPGIPLDRQDLAALNHMRNIIEEDYFDGRGLVHINKPVRGGLPWTSFWSGPEHVYFGHDARRGLQECEFATGLDTGCLYGGLLTGVFINRCRKIVSVKAHAVHYVGKPA